jgi:hypothetical protein
VPEPELLGREVQVPVRLEKQVIAGSEHGNHEHQRREKPAGRAAAGTPGPLCRAAGVARAAGVLAGGGRAEWAHRYRMS